MKVIVDAQGVLHRYERRARQNTRCGLRIDAAWRDGEPDCMACVAGPSLLTLRDLRDGVFVEVWVQLFDENHQAVGDRALLTFVEGSNIDGAEFTGIPVGTVVRGHSYQTEDGFVVWVSTWRESFVAGDDMTVGIDPGKAQVR